MTTTERIELVTRSLGVSHAEARDRVEKLKDMGSSAFAELVGELKVIRETFKPTTAAGPKVPPGPGEEIDVRERPGAQAAARPEVGEQVKAWLNDFNGLGTP